MAKQAETEPTPLWGGSLDMTRPSPLLQGPKPLHEGPSSQPPVPSRTALPIPCGWPGASLEGPSFVGRWKWAGGGDPSTASPPPQERSLEDALLSQGGEEGGQADAAVQDRDGNGKEWQAALVGPTPRKMGGGVGAGLGWRHLFWVFCRAGPPWASRAAQITRRDWGWGGESGQTGTYTTDVCSEKYSKIVMQR